MPFIIGVQSRGLPGFVRETAEGFAFTPDGADATVFATELDAKVARCYIEDEYAPTIVEIAINH